MAVTDMKSMIAFYQSVFSINFSSMEMNGEMLYRGDWLGLQLLLCPAELAGNTARQNRHQFDIVVEDLEQTMQLAQASGGKKLGEIMNLEDRLTGSVYDPDNNSMVFIQYK